MLKYANDCKKTNSRPLHTNNIILKRINIIIVFRGQNTISIVRFKNKNILRLKLSKKIRTSRLSKNYMVLIKKRVCSIFYITLQKNGGHRPPNLIGPA